MRIILFILILILFDLSNPLQQKIINSNNQNESVSSFNNFYKKTLSNLKNLKFKSDVEDKMRLSENSAMYEGSSTISHEEPMDTIKSESKRVWWIDAWLVSFAMLFWSSP
jgi:hypothetical protein